MPTANKNTLQAADQITRDEIYWNEGPFDNDMGDARSVSFAFRASTPDDFEYSDPANKHNEKNTFFAISADQRALILEALGLWSDAARISFNPSAPGGFTNSGSMLFGNYSSGVDANGNALDGAGAFAVPPGGSLDPGRDDDERNGDVWLNASGGTVTNPTLNSYTFETIIHEIGHAIGLQHPGNYNAAPGVTLTYNANAEYIQDTTQYSIMSYFSGGNAGGYNGPNADSPLLHDIAAVQRLYGINWATRNTDTVYGYNSTGGRAVYNFNDNTSVHLAIWDGGGTDTLDLSGAKRNLRIDLHQEAFSDIDLQQSAGASTVFNNLAIARLVDFENARGGSGDDSITGNALANDLRGNNGNDTLYGENGRDWLMGGVGNDLIYGGNDGDTIFGESGENTLFGEAGEDDIRGGANDDYIDGGTGNDQVTGSDGNDTLWGDEGNDGLSGNAGQDYLNGEAGDDVLDGQEGNDRLLGGTGINTIYGGSGDDRFESEAGGINTVNGGADNDWYVLGDGGDIITDDSGYDTLQFNTAVNANWQAGVYLGELSNDFWDPRLFEQYIGSAAADTIVMRSDFTTNFALRGGNGSDTLTSARGSTDLLQGGLGNDTLNGGGGSADIADFSDHFGDFFNGWSIDLIGGQAVTRTLVGSFGFSTETDTLVAIEGVIGSAGGDTIQAREGVIYSDVAVPLSPAVPLIDGGTGRDTLKLSPIIISAFSNNFGITADDVVTFGAAGTGQVTTATSIRINDFLSQSATGFLDFKSIETLETGDGNDVIKAWDGVIAASAVAVVPPMLDGGNGNDSLILNDTISNILAVGGRAIANDVVTFTAQGAGTVTTSTAIRTGILIQQAVGTLGFSGMETVETGQGNDRLEGSAGVETARLGAGDDTANLGSGVDFAYGNSGNDVLAGGAGGDLIDGGEDNDTADYRSSASGQVNVNLLADTASGGDAAGDTLDGIENLWGSLTLRDILIGDTGNNVLKGFGGNDSLIGNDGDDFIEGGTGGDTINGGAGSGDTASYRDSNVGQVSINLLSNIYSGGDAQGDLLFFIENLEGSVTRRDILIGNVVANRIFGNGGVDSIQGGDGNDVINGGTGGDSLNAGAGLDTVSYETSSAGVNVDLNVALQTSAGDASGDSLFFFENVTGSDFTDVMRGNYLSNMLKGGLGSDLLNGSTGSDYLTGGADADTFRFSDMGFGSDSIMDWQDGLDKISIALPLEASFAGLTFTSNGTTSVIVRGFNGTGSAIIVKADAAFTLDAGDFLFV